MTVTTIVLTFLCLNKIKYVLHTYIGVIITVISYNTLKYNFITIKFVSSGLFKPNYSLTFRYFFSLLIEGPTPILAINGTSINLH